MKICDRAINVMQVVWPKGFVHTCCWGRRLPLVGSVLESDIPQMRHGEIMQKTLRAMLQGDYSLCQWETGDCIFAANGTLKDHMVDIEDADSIPDYPRTLFLSFENSCNYNCTCCNAHNGGKECIPVESRETLDTIESKVREALPHIRQISANGGGEFFCSPRLMRLLSEWKPLAPKEECSVIIETNGSLFTPENWKKIENVGNFHLTVAITVMSFQEDVYQHLSGTTLPISNLESNLRFVRSLREQGIINYLELATVVQEENFREMPELARRCLDEFGADCFRFRPIFPGGIYDENIQWFMDMRNPEHPYFKQYQKMREDPIFKDPRVLIWSGDVVSNRGPHPAAVYKRKLGAIERLLDHPELLTDALGDGRVAVYNMGVVGRTAVAQCKNKANIVRCYSTRADMREFEGIPVMRFDEEPGGADAPDTVLIAAFNNREKAKEEIRRKLGQDVRIVDLWEKV